MTRTTAHELRLDLHAFPTMEKALRWACEHLTFTHTGTPYAVAVFREEIAHFNVFWVAVRGCPPIKKFHERIRSSL